SWRGARASISAERRASVSLTRRSRSASASHAWSSSYGSSATPQEYDSKIVYSCMGGLLVPVVLAISLCGSGKPVVAMSYGVQNDADTGIQGNTWALDTYTRSVRVWRLGRARFCAASTYGGTFATVPGPSPGGKWQLPAGYPRHVQGHVDDDVPRQLRRPRRAAARLPRRQGLRNRHLGVDERLLHERHAVPLHALRVRVPRDRERQRHLQRPAREREGEVHGRHQGGAAAAASL